MQNICFRESYSICWIYLHNSNVNAKCKWHKTGNLILNSCNLWIGPQLEHSIHFLCRSTNMLYISMQILKHIRVIYNQKLQNINKRGRDAAVILEYICRDACANVLTCMLHGIDKMNNIFLNTHIKYNFRIFFLCLFRLNFSLISVYGIQWHIHTWNLSCLHLRSHFNVNVVWLNSKLTLTQLDSRHTHSSTSIRIDSRNV